MTAVDDILQTNDLAIRKWGTQLLALQDFSAPVPSAFFDSEGLPLLPPGAKQLGFITTDGIVQAKSISSEPTNMVQQLEPVRRDKTGVEQSVTVTFGESSSAWVNALAHGKPVSEWGAHPHAPWIYDDGEITADREYRLIIIAADGVGDQAFYRVEYGYRAVVTAQTDRTLNRASSEGFGFTFGLMRDPVARKVLTRGENGPGFGTIIAPTGADAGAPGTFTPSGAYAPSDLSALQAIAATANPTTAWTAGQHVVLRDGSKAHWSGTTWVAGAKV